MSWMYSQLKKKEMIKAYVALFSATSQSVHMELVPNLSAESFVSALIRFKGRRGTPPLIASDNGKTLKDSRVQAYSCQRQYLLLRTDILQNTCSHWVPLTYGQGLIS